MSIVATVRVKDQAGNFGEAVEVFAPDDKKPAPAKKPVAEIRADVKAANKVATSRVSELTYANSKTAKYVGILLGKLPERVRMKREAREVELSPGQLGLKGFETRGKSVWMMGYCVVMSSLLQAGHISKAHIKERLEIQIPESMRPLKVEKWAEVIHAELIVAGLIEGEVKTVTVVDRVSRLAVEEESNAMPKAVRDEYFKGYVNARNKAETVNRMWDEPLIRGKDGKVTEKGYRNGPRGAVVKGYKGEVKWEFISLCNSMQHIPVHVSPLGSKIAQIMADTAHTRMPRVEDFARAEEFDEAIRKHEASVETVNLLASMKVGKDMYALGKYDFTGRFYLTSGSIKSQGTAVEKLALNLRSRGKYDARKWFLLMAFSARAFGLIIKEGDKEYTWEEQAAWMEEFMESEAFAGLRTWQDVYKYAKSFARSEAFDAVGCVEEIWRVEAELAKGVALEDISTSGLVFYLDGKTNVLEHIAALMRDRKSAEGANILWQERPVDAYTRVLEEVKMESVPEHLRELFLKATRDLAKSPVMLTIYGGSEGTIVDSIISKVRKLAEGMDVGDLGVATIEVVEIIIGALYRAYPAVMALTKRLKKAAAAALEEGADKWDWTTEDGFHIVDRAMDVEDEVVRTNSEAFNMGGEGRLDTRGMVTRLSPNFIHGLDAEHARRIMWECIVRGIDVLPIFDAFGTTLDKLDELNAVIHSTFADMYDKPNQSLNELLVGLGANPWMGSDELAVGEIAKANFVFN